MKTNRVICAVSTIFLLLSCITHEARASAELDKKYALETIGCLPSWDNVDGLFSDYVATSYEQYFSAQTRFVQRDMSKIKNTFAQTDIPYQKLIDDEAVLVQLARTMAIQTIIRTKIYKEGNNYKFVIEWLHAPKMNILAKYSFRIDDPGNGIAVGSDVIAVEIKKALDALFDLIPFVAQVTGRDSEWVTVNIGGSTKIKRGDTLYVATIEDVKLHPLLNTIVDWKLAPTGKLQVDDIDDGVAFCKVLEEDQNHQIGRFQKITRVVPAPDLPTEIQKKNGLIIEKVGSPTRDEEDNTEEEEATAQPRLGWASVGPWIGTFRREYTLSGSAVRYPTDGTLLGGRAEAQIWLTREFFTEIEFGYGSVGEAGTLSRFRFDLGYKYFVQGDFNGPFGWLRLGFKSLSYSLPISTINYTAPTSFSSVFFGIGGDLPIREGWGALLMLDFGIMKSLTETGLVSGVPIGETDASFYFGGYYNFKPKMQVRMGVEIVAHGADFDTGTVLTHRVLNFGPSLLFYF